MLKNSTPASPATARAKRVLPVPRRAHEEDAPGNTRAQVAIFLGIAKKIHFLLQLRLGLVGPGHIVESHFGLITRIAASLGAPEAEHAGLMRVALRLIHQKNPTSSNMGAHSMGPSKSQGVLVRETSIST